MYSSCLVFLGLLVFTSNSFAAVYALVGQGIKSKGIEKKALRELYLGYRKYLQEPSKVINPAIYFAKRNQMKSFYDLIGVSANEYKSVWRRKMFAGISVPPKKLQKLDQVESFFEDNDFGLVIVLGELKLKGSFRRLKIQ